MFLGKIYTADKNFTRPPVATVATNFKSAHSGKKSFKCDQCNFASSHVGSFRRHLKIHSGEKSHKCNLCDFASVTASDFRRHLKSHTGEKSYKCNQCEGLFSILDHFLRLKKQNPTGQFNYSSGGLSS